MVLPAAALQPSAAAAAAAAKRQHTQTTHPGTAAMTKSSLPTGALFPTFSALWDIPRNRLGQLKQAGQILLLAQSPFRVPGERIISGSRLPCGAARWISFGAGPELCHHEGLALLPGTPCHPKLGGVGVSTGRVAQEEFENREISKGGKLPECSKEGREWEEETTIQGIPPPSPPSSGPKAAAAATAAAARAGSDTGLVSVAF